MKKSIIFESFNEIKRKKFWQSLLFDALFLLCIGVIALLTSGIFNLISQKIGQVYLILSLIAYFIVIMVIYSFFKLKIIKLFYNSKERLVKFCFFNILITLIFAFIIIILYSLTSYFVKEEFQKTYFSIILLIVLFLVYILINLMQMLKVLKRNAEESLIIAGRNIGSVSLVFIGEILGLGLIYLVYLGTYSIAFRIININIIFQILTFFIIFFYNAFNRVVFLRAVLERR